MVDLFVKSLFVSFRFCVFIYSYIKLLIVFPPEAFCALWKKFRIELKTAKYFDEICDHCPHRDHCVDTFNPECDCYNQASEDAVMEATMTKEEIAAHYEKQDKEFDEMFNSLTKGNDDNVEK